MATSSSDFEILLGVPVAAAASAPILDIGGVGTIGALRTLTHPDSANFPPIVYSNNPDATSNLIDEVIPVPLASTKRTLGTTLVTRFEGQLDDVDCEESWAGTRDAKASMPGYLLRLFLNYLLNPPAIVPFAQEYLVWRPRDVTGIAYNVEFYRIKVGSGGAGKALNLKEVRANQDPIDNGFSGWDVDPTGFIDEPVVLTFHIVSVFT